MCWYSCACNPSTQTSCSSSPRPVYWRSQPDEHAPKAAMLPLQFPKSQSRRTATTGAERDGWVASAATTTPILATLQAPKTGPAKAAPSLARTCLCGGRARVRPPARGDGGRRRVAEPARSLSKQTEWIGPGDQPSGHKASEPLCVRLLTTHSSSQHHSRLHPSPPSLQRSPRPRPTDPPLPARLPHAQPDPPPPSRPLSLIGQDVFDSHRRQLHLL